MTWPPIYSYSTSGLAPRSFIFTLQEFALELITLADITGYVLEQSVERPGLLSKLKLFSRFKSPLRSYRNGGMEQRPTLKRQICKWLSN